MTVFDMNSIPDYLLGIFPSSEMAEKYVSSMTKRVDIPDLPYMAVPLMRKDQRGWKSCIPGDSVFLEESTASKIANCGRMVGDIQLTPEVIYLRLKNLNSSHFRTPGKEKSYKCLTKETTADMLLTLVHPVINVLVCTVPAKVPGFFRSTSQARNYFLTEFWANEESIKRAFLHSAYKDAVKPYGVDLWFCSYNGLLREQQLIKWKDMRNLLSDVVIFDVSK